MIRIGIIGAGGMGNAQAREFGKLKGCKVVAVCDVDPAKAKALAREHGVAHTYSDVDTMLQKAEIDAVSNITPDGLHKEVALKAIAAGKHILSEKPLATNYPDAEEMAKAAEAAGVINMVNFSYRGAPAIQHAKNKTILRDLAEFLAVDQMIEPIEFFLRNELAHEFFPEVSADAEIDQ